VEEDTVRPNVFKGANVSNITNNDSNPMVIKCKKLFPKTETSQ
jgi:hypothetical protein